MEKNTKEIVSKYVVTDYTKRKSFIEYPIGAGEEAIRFLRKQYPRFSKFVLLGFEIDGEFRRLNLYNR